MAELVIRFQNLAVFAYWDYGLTVLFPNANHGAELNGRINGDAINVTLDGHLIQLLRDGAPIRTPTTKAAGQYLVDLTPLLPPDWQMHAPDVLATRVSGRFELGGGTLVEHQSRVAANSKYRTFAWPFTHANNFTHALTDTCDFHLPLDVNSQYDLLVSSADGLSLHRLPTDRDTSLTLAVRESQPTVFIDTLDEFADLYQVLALDPAFQPPIPYDPDPEPRPAGTTATASVVESASPSMFCDFPLCPPCSLNATGANRWRA
jgi:hypothetical protein